VTGQLASLSGAECILLETCRKSGAAVATPVWFVVVDGLVYVRTLAHFGKVKRLRANPAVRFASCDWDGNVCGPWFHGRAALLSPDDECLPVVDALFDATYGERRAAMNRMVAEQGFDTVFIAITPASGEA